MTPNIMLGVSLVIAVLACLYFAIENAALRETVARQGLQLLHYHSAVPVYHLPLPDDRQFIVLAEYNGDHGQVIFELNGEAMYVHQEGVTVHFLRALLYDVEIWNRRNQEYDDNDED